MRGGSTVREVRVAVAGGFSQEWGEFRSDGLSSIVKIAVLTAPSVIFGWLAGQRGTPELLTYAAYGSAFVALWTLSVFLIGFMLSQAVRGGTYELSLAAPAPVAAAMFGKGLAIMASTAPAALVSVGAVVLVARDWPSLERPALFAGGLVVALGAVVALAFVLSPFTVLSGGRGGFMNIFIALGPVLSAFLFPRSALPPVLDVVGLALPTSWAMKALIGSALGEESTATIVQWWAAAIVLAFVWVALTVVLFSRVERRLCVTGRMQTG